MSLLLDLVYLVDAIAITEPLLVKLLPNKKSFSLFVSSFGQLFLYVNTRAVRTYVVFYVS